MPVTMPSLSGYVVASNFYLETNTQIFESPLNRTVQTVALAGARWRADITLRAMKKQEAAQWIAFFLQLRGMSDTFTMQDPDWRVNLGLSTGSPLVNGAGQTGNSLVVDSCPANVTNWLRPADYFQIGDELKRVVAPVNTNGSGQATITFEPRIRVSPADNSSVIIRGAAGKFRLMDDQQLQWEIGRNGTYPEKTFSCFESIP